MFEITKRELIDYCNSRESEVCNECKYYIVCLNFVRSTGHIPHKMEKSKHYNDELVTGVNI